ncbi:MAG: hypothetical protein ACYC6M_15865 [Terriglobales bacterium]
MTHFDSHTAAFWSAHAAYRKALYDYSRFVPTARWWQWRLRAKEAHIKADLRAKVGEANARVQEAAKLAEASGAAYVGELRERMVVRA